MTSLFFTIAALSSLDDLVYLLDPAKRRWVLCDRFVLVISNSLLRKRVASAIGLC